MKKIFFNGKIITMNNKEPMVEAVLIDDEKIVKIGSKEEILNEKDENSIRTFVVVISLIAQASAIKKLVQKIVNEYHS